MNKALQSFEKEWQGGEGDPALTNLTLAYGLRMAGLLQRELSENEKSATSLRAACARIQACMCAEGGAESDVVQSLILLETIIDLAE